MAAFRETSTGREREEMTAALMGRPDEDAVRHVLTDLIGPNVVHREQGKKLANGGSPINLKDLCCIASNDQLRDALDRLKGE